jgi:hypothetical protein
MLAAMLIATDSAMDQAAPATPRLLLVTEPALPQATYETFL